MKRFVSKQTQYLLALGVFCLLAGSTSWGGPLTDDMFKGAKLKGGTEAEVDTSAAKSVSTEVVPDPSIGEFKWDDNVDSGNINSGGAIFSNKSSSDAELNAMGVQTVDQQAASCEAAISSAETACSVAKYQAGIQGLASATMANLSASSSSADPAQACKSMAQNAGAQVALSASITGTCTYKVSACKTACAKDPKLVKCGEYDGAIAAMLALGANAMNEGTAYKNCQNYYSQQKANVQNCSNPNFRAQNGKACACLSNPNDPNCMSIATGGLNNFTPGATNPGGASGLSAEEQARLKAMMDALKNKQNASGGPAAPATGAAPGGGGGGGLGGGGGGANPLAGADNGAGDSGAGRTSGLSFGSLANGGGSRLGNPTASESTLGNMAKFLKAKFNMNNLKDPVGRDPASVSVAGRDGITPANGKSIWDKITTRYQINSNQLLPP